MNNNNYYIFKVIESLNNNTSLHNIMNGVHEIKLIFNDDGEHVNVADPYGRQEYCRKCGPFESFDDACSKNHDLQRIPVNFGGSCPKNSGLFCQKCGTRWTEKPNCCHVVVAEVPPVGPLQNPVRKFDDDRSERFSHAISNTGVTSLSTGSGNLASTDVLNAKYPELENYGMQNFKKPLFMSPSKVPPNSVGTVPLVELKGASFAEVDANVLANSNKKLAQLSSFRPGKSHAMDKSSGDIGLDENPKSKKAVMEEKEELLNILFLPDGTTKRPRQRNKEGKDWLFLNGYEVKLNTRDSTLLDDIRKSYPDKCQGPTLSFTFAKTTRMGSTQDAICLLQEIANGECRVWGSEYPKPIKVLKKEVQSHSPKLLLVMVK